MKYIIFMIMLAGNMVVSAVNIDKIKAADYPELSSNITFFEERVNAIDHQVRLRLLYDICARSNRPDKEFVSFLKRFYKDPNENVRGYAIKKLYDMRVKQPLEKLPMTFTGYHNSHFINKNKPIKLIQDLRTGGLTAGYAAYVAGLLKFKKAIPELKKLDNEDNIFIRLEAARALMECGESKSALAIFDRESLDQISRYQEKQKQLNPAKAKLATEPWYAIAACKGLIYAKGESTKIGFKRIIQLMGFLENAEDVNDQSNLHNLRIDLSLSAGTFLANSLAAKKWFKEKYE